MAMSEDTSDDWGGADLKAMLRHQLASPVSAVDQDSPAPPADAGSEDEGETFGALFACAAPAPETLAAVKDFAKRSQLDASHLLPEPVATVLYFAALAAALVRCDRRITRLDDQALRTGFTWTTEQAWVDVMLRRLCAEAVGRLGN